MRVFISLLLLFTSTNLIGQTNGNKEIFRLDDKYGIGTVSGGNSEIVDTLIPAKYASIRALKQSSGKQDSYLLAKKKEGYGTYKGVTLLDSNLREYKNFQKVIDQEDSIILFVNNEEYGLYDCRNNKTLISKMDNIEFKSKCLQKSPVPLYGYGSNCMMNLEFWVANKDDSSLVLSPRGEFHIRSQNEVSWIKDYALFKAGDTYYSSQGNLMGTNIDSVFIYFDESKLNYESLVETAYLILRNYSGKWDLWKSSVGIDNRKPIPFQHRQKIMSNLPSEYTLNERQYSDSIFLFNTPKGFVLMDKKGNQMGDGTFDEVLPIQDKKGSLIYVSNESSFYALDFDGEKFPTFNGMILK